MLVLLINSWDYISIAKQVIFNFFFFYIKISFCSSSCWRWQLPLHYYHHQFPITITFTYCIFYFSFDNSIVREAKIRILNFSFRNTKRYQLKFFLIASEASIIVECVRGPLLVGVWPRYVINSVRKNKQSDEVIITLRLGIYLKSIASCQHRASIEHLLDFTLK